jgi:ADP-ribose pyrophosphatase
MSIKHWKQKSEEIVFEKYGRQVIKRIYIMPDGDEADFYIKKEKNTAGVLALTSDNHVILVKQFRPGPNKVLLELPGGFMDKPNDPPEKVALKELLEETGYKGNKVEFVVQSIDDAYSTVLRNLFVVTGCEKISEQTLEKTEFAQVVLLRLSEFRDLLRSGQMTDIEAGYLALDHLKLL